MASSSLFDEHACYDLPTCLWRTNDPWSQAQIDSTDGYLKAATQTMPESLAELKEAVEQHLDWYSDVPSPFISTLSDQGHARDWATKRARRNERQPGYISDISPLLDTSPWLVTHLFEFETSSLNKYTWIFHLCSLINSFDIIVPQTLHATEDEYLISSFAPVKIALMSQFDCGQKYGEYTFDQVYPLQSPAATDEGHSIWEKHIQLDRYTNASSSARQTLQLTERMFQNMQIAEQEGLPVSSNLRDKTESLKILGCIDHHCEENRANILGARYIWPGNTYIDLIRRNPTIKIGLLKSISLIEKNPDVTAAERRAVRKFEESQQEIVREVVAPAQFNRLFNQVEGGEPEDTWNQSDDEGLGLERLTIQYQ